MCIGLDASTDASDLKAAGLLSEAVARIQGYWSAAITQL